MSAPAVAVSHDGSKFAATWKDVRTGDAKVYWAVSDTASFSHDAPVHPKLLVQQNHPSITIDASHTVWVAWEESQSQSQQIWMRSSASSDEAQAITSVKDGWASFPVVASNAGLIGVVYELTRDDDEKVVFQLIETSH